MGQFKWIERVTSPFPSSIKKIAISALSHQIADRTVVDHSRSVLEACGLEVVILQSCWMDHEAHTRSEAEYPAAPVAQRVDELHECWEDQSVSAVLPLMGGAGIAELLPELDWHLLRRRDVPILGYSDICALHLAMYARGVLTPISSPNAIRLAQALARGDELTATTLRHALDPGSNVPPSIRCEVVQAGSTVAPALAMSLGSLLRSFSTPFGPSLAGHVLILEQPPMGDSVFLEQALIQLCNAGVLQGLAGMLLGEFEGHGRERWRRRLFEKYADYVPGPVLMGFPYGHSNGVPMACVRWGTPLAITKTGDVFLH